MVEETEQQGARWEVAGLGLLFGAMYFVQGIGEPTEGLIAQPVRSLLKSWGHTAGEIAMFSAILALPWSLKPLYGILTDFVPIAGYRRKSYLIAASLAAAVGLAVLWAAKLEAGSRALLLCILLVPTVGVAFSDVVVDALMVEKGQRHNATGLFQSIQWACIYSATILTGLVGGYLSQHGRQQLGFLICAVAAVCTLILAIFFVREDRHSVERPSLRSALATLGRAGRSRAVLAVGGFIFLWNFNPFTNDVLYLHMTGEMQLTEQFYGTTVSLMAIASVAASAAYGFYCRRIPLAWLIHGSIVLGILSTVGYWAMVDRTSAVIVTLAVGFTYMTAMLIQLDLAARACPAEVSGTAFAILMALSNLSVSLSTAAGGYLYDRWAESWGAVTAFNLLVGCGAVLTAGCWLLVPALRRSGAHHQNSVRM